MAKSYPTDSAHASGRRKTFQASSPDPRDVDNPDDTRGLTRQEFLAWEQVSRDTIDVKRCYIDLAKGDLVAGVLLSQIIYWHLPAKDGSDDKLYVERDGEMWLPKGRADWWDQCRISAKQYDRASAILGEIGVIETHIWRHNGNPTTHIRIIWSVFLRLLAQTCRAEKRSRPMGKNVFPLRVKTRLPDGEEHNSPNREERSSPSGENQVPQTGNLLHTENLVQTPSENKENSQQNQQQQEAAPLVTPSPTTEHAVVVATDEKIEKGEEARSADPDAGPDPGAVAGPDAGPDDEARKALAFELASEGMGQAQAICAARDQYDVALEQLANLRHALPGEKLLPSRGGWLYLAITKGYGPTKGHEQWLKAQKARAARTAASAKPAQASKPASSSAETLSPEQAEAMRQHARDSVHPDFRNLGEAKCRRMISQNYGRLLAGETLERYKSWPDPAKAAAAAGLDWDDEDQGGDDDQGGENDPFGDRG